MPSVKCEKCQGTGRTEHPFAKVAGSRSCDFCRGSGLIKGYNPGVLWHRETCFGLTPSLEIGETLVRSGGVDRIPLPAELPTHIVCDADNGPEAGWTCAIELVVDGLVLTYSGVPIEESDIRPDEVVMRLDRALTVDARRE